MLRALAEHLGTGVAGDRRQLRRGRLPHVDRARTSSSPGSSARSAASTSSWSCRRSRRGRRQRACRRERRRRRELDRSGAWSSSAGTSAARTSARSPATASSARRRPARRPTTSRTAGRCSRGGSTRMAVTFIAAHSLHARPLVVPRGTRRRDPQPHARRARLGARRRPHRRRARRRRAGRVRLGEQRSLLAHLPESTFFRRYRETFAS